MKKFLTVFLFLTAFLSRSSIADLYDANSIALEFAKHYYTGQGEKAFLLTAYSTNTNDPDYNKKRNFFLKKSDLASNRENNTNLLSNIGVIDDDSEIEHNQKTVKLALTYEDGSQKVAVVVMMSMDGQWYVSSFNNN